MYLPRSTPPNQVQVGLINDPLLGQAIEEEDRFVSVDLHGSSSASAALEKLQMSAQVILTAHRPPAFRQLTGCPFKANAAVAKNIHLWRFNTPHAHPLVLKTPLVAPTYHQGRFPGYPSYQESQDSDKSRGQPSRDSCIKG